MKAGNTVTKKNAIVITIVDAPDVLLAPDEKVGELLRTLIVRWVGMVTNILNLCEIRTTKDVYNRLYSQIYERYPNPVSV